jgi:hypothetical protein
MLSSPFLAINALQTTPKYIAVHTVSNRSFLITKRSEVTKQGQIYPHGSKRYALFRYQMAIGSFFITA